MLPIFLVCYYLVPNVRKGLANKVQKHIKTSQGSWFGANTHFHSSTFTQESGHIYENEVDIEVDKQRIYTDKAISSDKTSPRRNLRR